MRLRGSPHVLARRSDVCKSEAQSLRRALNLAYQWGTLERPAKISLAKGESQRDRVLTDAEMTAYLAACPQPWQDTATVIRGTGMRPGEVFTLRWERVLLNADRPLLQVTEGKSKAAKRILPLVPAVHSALLRRWQPRPPCSV